VAEGSIEASGAGLANPLGLDAVLSLSKHTRLKALLGRRSRLRRCPEPVEGL